MSRHLDDLITKTGPGDRSTVEAALGFSLDDATWSKWRGSERLRRDLVRSQAGRDQSVPSSAAPAPWEPPAIVARHRDRTRAFAERLVKAPEPVRNGRLARMHVDELELEDRVAICDTCPDRAGHRCTRCGCPAEQELATQLGASAFRCPLARFPTVERERPAAEEYVGHHGNPCRVRHRDGTPTHLGRLFAAHPHAFLVCSGPSLRSLDLHRLRAWGVVAMGVNNSPAGVHAGGRGWRPNLHTYVDPPKKFCEQLFADPQVMTFAPARESRANVTTWDRERRAYDPVGRRVEQCANVWLYDRHATFDPSTYLTEPGFSWGCDVRHSDPDDVAGSKSVMLVAVKLLFYLGVRNLYILGADFGAASDDGAWYAFPQSKDRRARASNHNTFARLDRRFRMLRPYFRDAGFHVWNCTPGGNLHAFPRMAFDDALERASLDQTLRTDGRYGGT